MFAHRPHRPHRLLSLLLRLYPADFRRRFEPEWREVAEWHRKALDGKPFGRVRLVALLLGDAVKALPAAYGFVGQYGPGGRPRRLDAFRRDVRHALRGLARNPVFTAAAAASLALGIGATTAVFSVVDAVLLRPLPYEEPERLVIVWNEFPGAGLARLPMAGVQVAALKEEPDLFEDVAAVWATSATLTGADGEPAQVSTGLVSPNLLTVLGLDLALGPGFVPDGSPAPQGVLLSEELWRTAFGADPGIVGRTITVEGGPVAVAGVLPAGFRLYLPEDAGVPPRFDLYTPLPWDLGVLPAGQRYLRVVGRLRPGVDLARAAVGVAAAGERALAAWPELQRSGDRLSVHPLHADSVRTARPVLLALLGAVGLFLLLACANVANLMLARTAGRLRELAIRTSIGASRRGLAQLLLVESLLLTALGAAAGLALGRAGASLLWSLRPAGLVRVELPKLHGSVLLFAVAVSAATAVVFALTTLWATRSVEPAGGLKGGFHPTGAMGRRFRELVTAGQVAVGLVLLVGSALMIQSVTRLGRESVGFVPDGALTFKLSLNQQRFPLDEDRSRAAAEVERRVGALSGVVAVGATSHLPFATWANWGGPAPPEGTPDEERNAWSVDLRSVTAGFLEAAEVRLVAGRLLEEGDDASGRHVVVIDRTMARRAFGDADPIGRILVPARYTDGSFPATPAVVVGVIEDIRDRSPGRPSDGQVFWPFAQSARWELTYLVRAVGEPAALGAAVRREVEAVDSRLAISDVTPMDTYVRGATALTRFLALVGGVFSGLAVVLAAVGLYGVVAFVTVQRLPELGMRTVLGATRRRLLGGIVWQGVRVAAIGVGVGTLAALGLTSFMQTLVYGVSPRDPATLAAVGAGLLAVAAAASVVPALRAARVDPLAALRER
jgi:predicted permease